MKKMTINKVKKTIKAFQDMRSHKYNNRPCCRIDNINVVKYTTDILNGDECLSEVVYYLGNKGQFVNQLTFDPIYTKEHLLYWSEILE